MLIDVAVSLPVVLVMALLFKYIYRRCVIRKRIIETHIINQGILKLIKLFTKDLNPVMCDYCLNTLKNKDFLYCKCPPYTVINHAHKSFSIPIF